MGRRLRPDARVHAGAGTSPGDRGTGRGRHTPCAVVQPPPPPVLACKQQERQLTLLWHVVCVPVVAPHWVHVRGQGRACELGRASSNRGGGRGEGLGGGVSGMARGRLAHAWGARGTLSHLVARVAAATIHLHAQARQRGGVPAAGLQPAACGAAASASVAMGRSRKCSGERRFAVLTALHPTPAPVHVIRVPPSIVLPRGL